MDTQKYIAQKEYIIPKDKFSEYLILSISIFLLIGIWILIMYYSENYNQVQVGNSSGTLNKNGNGASNKNLGGTSQTYNYLICDPGQCPTNVSTGEKRCPADGTKQMLYDPVSEVCNPKDSCTNTKTPYSMNFDLSTNAQGICDISGCRCVNYFQTPSYTQALFQVSGGNIYTTNPNLISKWYFTQIPTTTFGQGNNAPIQYQDPLNQYYEISSSLIGFVSPSTQACFEVLQNGKELDIADTLKCVNSNPCISGKMAYIQGYGESITDFNYFVDPVRKSVACVPAVVDNPIDIDNPLDCFDYQVPVLNYITGKITCVSPPL